MTKSEVQAILMAAKAVDDRIAPDEARTAAWMGILNPSMTFDVARRALMAHYAESTDVLMPAHLNRAWHEHQRQVKAEEARVERHRELDGPPAPMPDHIRQLLRNFGRSKAEPQ